MGHIITVSLGFIYNVVCQFFFSLDCFHTVCEVFSASKSICYSHSTRNSSITFSKVWMCFFEDIICSREQKSLATVYYKCKSRTKGIVCISKLLLHCVLPGILVCFSMLFFFLSLVSCNFVGMEGERPARLNRAEADRDTYRRSAAPRKYTDELCFFCSYCWS